MEGCPDNWGLCLNKDPADLVFLLGPLEGYKSLNWGSK